jgi:hypothetical protein
MTKEEFLENIGRLKEEGFERVLREHITKKSTSELLVDVPREDEIHTILHVTQPCLLPDTPGERYFDTQGKFDANGFIADLASLFNLAYPEAASGIQILGFREKGKEIVPTPEEVALDELDVEGQEHCKRGKPDMGKHDLANSAYVLGRRFGSHGHAVVRSTNMPMQHCDTLVDLASEHFNMKV